MRTTFRGQLILGLLPVCVLLVTTVLTAVAGVWPAAVMQAVFLLTSVARVIALFRMRRLGGFSSDGPPGALLNREYLLVLRTQLVGWIAAGVYFAVSRFWWGVLLAVFLAYITLPLMQLINRKAREHAQPTG